LADRLSADPASVWGADPEESFAVGHLHRPRCALAAHPWGLRPAVADAIGLLN